MAENANDGVMHSSDSEVPRLDYAPHAPKWRRWVRRTAVLCALMAGAACVYWWGPGLWRNAQAVYWQRQCMNYIASGDQVVYEEELTAGQRLLATPGEYRSLPITVRPAVVKGGEKVWPPVGFWPGCWTNLKAVLPPSGLRMTMLGVGGGPGAVVFLHGVRSPGGTRYLVEVEFARRMDTFQPQWIQGFNCTATVVIPGTFFTAPRPVPVSYALSVMSEWPAVPPNVRIYAGQTDATDPSHFTIRYEMWGKTDVVDGRIDDAGRVTLKQRNVPEWPR